jgi:hypothetical protein
MSLGTVSAGSLRSRNAVRTQQLHKAKLRHHSEGIHPMISDINSATSIVGQLLRHRVKILV